jgi:hypothetical protein
LQGTTKLYEDIRTLLRYRAVTIGVGWISFMFEFRNRRG